MIKQFLKYTKIEYFSNEQPQSTPDFGGEFDTEGLGFDSTIVSEPADGCGFGFGTVSGRGSWFGNAFCMMHGNKSNF